MPIIPQVGRKSPKLRFVMILLYLVVITGAATVVYPFALMVSLGFTTSVDYPDFKLVPKFLFDNEMLFKKYLDIKYQMSARVDGQGTQPIEELNKRYGTEYLQFRDANEWFVHKQVGGKDIEGAMTFPPNDPGLQARVQDWKEFRMCLDPNYFDVCRRFNGSNSLPGPSFDLFVATVRKRYNGNIDLMNTAYGSEAEVFYGSIDKRGAEMMNDNVLRPDWWQIVDVRSCLRHVDWYIFKTRVPAECRQVVSGRDDYQKFLLARVNLWPEDLPAKQKKVLGAAYGLNVDDYRKIPFPQTQPDNPGQRGAWEEFVRKNWSGRFVKLTGGEAEYAAFLKGKFGTIGAINKRYGTAYESFNDPGLFTASMPAYLPKSLGEFGKKAVLRTPEEVTAERILISSRYQPIKLRAMDWQEFIQTRCPLKYIKLEDGEHRYKEWVAKKYGSVDGINKAYHTSFASLEDVRPPYKEGDLMYVNDNRWPLKKMFITQNFAAVGSYVGLQGRAMWNTLILVALTVFTHLTISPLAAFVLSRFRLPYTYKILLFLIATMAFPGEVASVPSFLLLKNLHLFNTYWALILPGLANGFGIFILKSFFDSLPEELFEAATIDGAGELRQFWNVAVPLTKPIFAVNALGSFTAAYGGFMWAFLVCRDPKMWTLMVYLWQFQMNSGSPSLMMSALVLAALPTLLIFIFCQQIILRGIVLPQFK